MITLAELLSFPEGASSTANVQDKNDKVIDIDILNQKERLALQSRLETNIIQSKNFKEINIEEITPELTALEQEQAKRPKRRRL